MAVGIQIISPGKSARTHRVGISDTPAKLSISQSRNSNKFQVGVTNRPFGISFGGSGGGNVGIMSGPPQGAIFDYGGSQGVNKQTIRKKSNNIGGGNRNAAFPGMTTYAASNYDFSVPQEQNRGGGNRTPVKIKIGSNGAVNKCIPLRSARKD